MRKSHYRIASDKETPRGKLCALLGEFSHELKRAYTKSSAKRCLKRGIYVAAAVAELAKQAKEEFEVVMVRNDRDTLWWFRNSETPLRQA